MLAQPWRLTCGFPRRMIIEHHDKESRYLQDVLLALEQNFSESEYEAKLDFQSTRDDVKNKVWAEAAPCQPGAGEGFGDTSLPLVLQPAARG